MALLATACSQTTESLEQGGQTPSSSSGDKGEISFGAYINRLTTRSGAVGTLTTEGGGAGEVAMREKGFGVTAFHTADDKLYDPTCKPNFMYNQKVTWLAGPGVWDYYPMKYWPNQTGENGSETTDRLSFFAYAPWVNVDTSTGKVADDGSGDYSDVSGIIAMTSNTTTGDPSVRYVASLKPDERVDLCWATPKIDQVKPASTSTKLDLQFNHALASLNLLIDAYVDGTDASNALPTETRVWVRSVTFEGFTLKGSFNLNQAYSALTDPEWNEPYTNDVVNHDPITVKDGRSDGLEGKSESKNEKPLGLNPVLVQSMTYADLTGTYESDPLDDAHPARGVYNDIRNLFDVSGSYVDADKPTLTELGTLKTEPVYVIPTDRPLRITIAYDIETRAANLPGYLADGMTHGVSVHNVISTTVQTTSGDLHLQPGKNYTVRLHLGLSSVQYKCAVTAWGAPVAPEDIEMVIDNLSLNEMMLNVYVKPWLEQEEVTLSVPMTDLIDLSTYFKAARSGDDDVSGQYIGRNVDAEGNIEGIVGSDYAAPAVGRIAYISTDGSDVESSLTGSRILVMAKETDFGTYTYKWDSSLTPTLQGYTDILAVNGCTFTATHDDVNFPAAYQSKHVYYEGSTPELVPAISGNTGWFLPSKQQMVLIGCNDGSAINQANALGLSSGGFWCATEQDAETARCYVDGSWTVASKNTEYKIRPVFAY